MHRFLVYCSATQKQTANLHTPPHFCFNTTILLSFWCVWRCFYVFPTGHLLCMRCWGRMNSLRWKTQTARMERTLPPQLNTPWCRYTIAGCSTLGATSSTRTEVASQPYRGDSRHHMSYRITREAALHTVHEDRSRFLWDTLTFPTPSTFLQTVCTGFFYLYSRYHIFLASHSHSPFLSWLILLLCVPWHVSRDGAAGSVTDGDNRK